LNIAYEKRDRNASEILYLNQDMRELDLYSTVGTVYCLCDGLNYLTETEDIETVFSLVYNFLYPGGLFIFDFNTVHKYRDVIGNRTIAENRDDVSFIWENTYDEENEINEYDLTVFARAELYDYNEEEQSEEKDLFRRFEEIHYQRGYSLKIMEEMLRKTGFSIVKTFDEEDSSPGDSSERIFAVARKDR
ncbi:MAG: class I SAM-dependent methyltransferase, partial [Lachnospiraceae bacterium]|nr:class I SAM-dependent methyltransferase [Lachnospiraceae bacterium]